MRPGLRDHTVFDLLGFPKNARPLAAWLLSAVTDSPFASTVPRNRPVLPYGVPMSPERIGVRTSVRVARRAAMLHHAVGLEPDSAGNYRPYPKNQRYRPTCSVGKFVDLASVTLKYKVRKLIASHFQFEPQVLSHTSATCLRQRRFFCRRILFGCVQPAGGREFAEIVAWVMTGVSKR